MERERNYGNLDVYPLSLLSYIACLCFIVSQSDFGIMNIDLEMIDNLDHLLIKDESNTNIIISYYTLLQYRSYE